jgi:Tfp pilus assembly PilM family ATPase/Tfp pilus assembly protein PilN
VNLKERLSSTENLLRSIRSGEAFASLRKPKDKKVKAAPEAQPIPTPTPGNMPAALLDSQPTPALHVSPAKKPFWNRALSFGPAKNSAVLGVSMTAGRLSLALLSGGTIVFSTRFPFGPDQAFGQKGFPAFLRTCLESVRDKAPQPRVWAVLRSQDLDLNVLTVPKLSGAKLDAAVYWTQQKEKKFAESEYAMDYVVLGPAKDSKESRLDVLTCLARRVDVDTLGDAFREAGWPLEGITTLPSAMQALYRLPSGPKGFALAANIHVEEDASTIGLYADGNLRFSRFIRSGTDSMAEAVLVHFQDQSKPKSRPAQQSGELELPPPGAPQEALTDGSAVESGEGADPGVLPPLDAMQAKSLMRHALLGGPVPKGVSPGHILGEAQMLEAIAPAIDRLAKQVERTLEFYATSHQLRCDVVHCSGRIFRSSGVFETLAGQLGYPHLAFDATTMLPSKPDAVSKIDRMALAPALAASLSAPDKGINLLRNYKQRAAVQARQLITRALLLGLALGLVVIAVAGYVIEQKVGAHRKELAIAQRQLSSLGPVIDEATLTRAVGQFSARQKSLREASARLTAPVVLAELSRRVPAGLKLLNVTIDLGVPPAGPVAPPSPGQPKAAVQPSDLVTLEGIVLGDKAELEPTLSRFVIELEASPLFSMPVVHQTGLKDLGAEGQVLHFVLHMGVQ